MRVERIARALAVMTPLAVCAGACGRIGYDALSAADGGGGSSGAGGGAGSAATGRGGAGGIAGAAGGGGGAAGIGGSVGGDGGAAGGTGGAAIVCNPGTHGTHQYLFCDALVDWAAARSECERRGMRLVRIDDDTENTWLQANAVFSASMFRREALWLGGFEPTTDGDWHWTDGDAFWSGAANGTAVGGRFTNWNGNEPNNATGPEACLAMSLNGTTWYDWACAAAHYFACEMY
jgi:hypothetical protein